MSWAVPVQPRADTRFRFHPLQVAQVQPATRDAIAVTFTVPPELAPQFRFIQGQYLTLRTTLAGEELRRSYSICAAVQDQELRVAIKRVPGGVFSNWALQNLKPGAMIDVLPPQGNFHVPLQPDAARHIVAFACGSGITPVLAIVKTTLLAEPGSRVTLVYGNRASGSVMFKEELAQLKDRFMGRLTLVWIMSREVQDIDLFNGRIDYARCRQLLAQWIAPVGIDAVFICGPQEMMRSTAQALQDAGVAPASIRTELFGAAPADGQVRAPRAPAPGSGQCTVEVVQDGTRRSFVMERGADNLVDAGIKAGLEMPYSCKGGVCSTCMAQVVEGEVEMDNHIALEDYEVARGFVLCCQSYPLTDRLVLDFDREHVHT